jgi:hypothetical protein
MQYLLLLLLLAAAAAPMHLPNCQQNLKGHSALGR